MWRGNALSSPEAEVLLMGMKITYADYGQLIVNKAVNNDFLYLHLS